MKHHERALALLAAVIALVAACTSTGSDVASPVVTPTVEASAVEATAAPTPIPVPEVSNDDLIAAALADYEADPQPEGTIAWDVLSSRVDDGLVSFNMCTWDGLTVTDTVHDIKYETGVDPDGTISTRGTRAAPTSGECLNTQLIDSAIATINAHDEYWAAVDLEPELFRTDPRSRDFFTEKAYRALEELTDRWVSDGVYFVVGHLGTVPESLEAPLAYRHYIGADDQAILDVATCRPMNPAYGLYRNQALLDDFDRGDEPGPHSVDQYHLVPDPDAELGWRIDQTSGRGWTDCYFTGDWSEFLAVWRPEPADWELAE